MEAIEDVNPDKYGYLTPETLIPIVAESEVLANESDYLIVLPWHFRIGFLAKYILKKERMVFPPPELEIVNAVGS